MPERIHIPAGRAVPLGRASLLLAGGVICFLPPYQMWPALKFAPSAVSNRITDYAIAWLLGILILCGLALCWRSVRWAAFALWPGRTGFELAADGIHARLGPFGDWFARWTELTIDWPEYLFDLDLSRDDPLPMNECPPISKTPGRPKIDLQLRRLAQPAESQWWPLLEERLRPLLFDDPRWED